MRDCAIVAFVAAGFWGFAYFGVNWTRDGGRTAAIWLPNAFAVGVLLRTDERLRVYLLAACLLSNLAVYLQIGDSPARSLALATINAVEIFFVVKATSRACGPIVWFHHLRTLLQFTGIAIFVTLLSGAPVTVIVAAGTGLAGFEIWGNWFAAHTLGFVIATPLVAIAIDRWRDARRTHILHFVQWLPSLAIVLAASLVIFSQSTFPLLFLASPLVVFAAFRMGVAGTAAAVAIISLVAIIATLADSGPIALVRGELWLSLITLQLFLAINFLIGLPVAAVLEERNAIRHHLADAVASSQTISDNLREVIFRTDPQGRWVFLNPAWESLTGYPVADWIGRTSYRLIVDDDFVAAQAEFAKLASGEADEVETRQRFRHADGSIRHIDVSIRRLTDESGAFTGAIGNIRDVTETVAQQDALAASEDRFRRLAESAPAGVYRADNSGKLTYVNAAWAAKVGMTADEMLGDGWIKAVADLAPYADNPPWIGFSPGEVRRRETRFRAADGSDLWMEIVNTGEWDSSGELQGFVGIAIDITRQKLANEELANRDAELSLLAANATDAVFRLSLDGVCRYASPSAHRLLGLPANSLIGANLITGFHPDDRKEVEYAFATLRQGDTDQRLVAFRSERINAPGQFFWLEANCGLVRNAGGAPVEIIASIRDISTRKALENALKIARNRAEDAVRARSAFLANMSHEIRTPMNGVIGFTEVLLAGELSMEQRRQIDLIAESGRAMLGLLNDILDMSKIEAGQMTLAPEPVDVRHVMNSSLRMLKPAAEAKNLPVEISASDEIPEFILADPLRLRQILLNLLSNAIKFTERGHVRLRAEARQGDAGRQIIIIVEDSGIGMAANRLEAIFAPFAQADDNTAHRFGGTGLGLSISQQLARLMGGEISVASEEGVGTVFTLALPLSETWRSTEAAQEAVSPADVAALTDVRVLVAEDNDINQELMRDMAAKAGVEIDIADDGESAIDMVRRAARSGSPYAMVLMDLRMPGIGGLEATRRLRQVGYSADELPIIALTANAFQDDIDACIEAGMQGHLGKPLRLSDFKKTLRRYAGLSAPGKADSLPSPNGDNLAQRYAARKNDIMARIATLAVSENVVPEEVNELAEMLHRLAGTAGAFGEEKLGEAAATLEQALRSAGPNQILPLLANADLLLSAAD